MPKASLIATLKHHPSPNGKELIALPNSVEWLEVRADLVGDLDPAWLRDHFKGRLLFTLRSKDEGGNNSDSLPDRHRRLETAAHVYDRVELESRDLSQKLLAQIPIEKRLISWHGPANDLPELQTRFARLSSTPASLYKLVTMATKIRDEFGPLSLLKSLARTDTIAYSTGLLGFWSRLAALQLGAPAISGLVSQGRVSSSEPPTIEKLIDHYGLPEVGSAKQLFAIIGNPIFHSLSPRLHNRAYRAINFPALFVPLQVESFAEFWREFVLSKVLHSLGLPINGMTVASPHKEEALLSAKEVSSMSRWADSANILTRNNGWWNADTTDPEVIYMAGRERRVHVKSKRAAVIGCGGAGRAIAAALVKSGAGVTLINRGEERGNKAAGLLGLDYVPLPDFDAKGYDIVVNATPVGRDSDEIPFKIESLNDEAVVIDLVYGSRPTPLVGSTLARERVVIDGRDVLLTQVLQQFRMMTGREMSVALALETLGRPTAKGKR